MLELESEFRLGLGGFDRLPLEQRARLMAYLRVKRDPEGKNTKEGKRRDLVALQRAIAQHRG